MNKQLALLVCLGVTLVGSQRAWAIKPFADAFLEKYVAGSDNKQFIDAVKGAKCNICHLAGEEKTERNPYGQALAELLDKKADAKNPQKINDSLDKVADMKAPDSDKTFGDLIKAGKLPGGDAK